MKPRKLPYKKFLESFKYAPQGHVVDLVYRCQMKPGVSWRRQETPGEIKPVGDTAEVRFFKKLPANIGFNHRETLKKLGFS